MLLGRATSIRFISTVRRSSLCLPWTGFLDTRLNIFQIIYIARNPKDVVVSFYYYICYLKPVTRYDGKFKDFCDLFIQDKRMYM